MSGARLLHHQQLHQPHRPPNSKQHPNLCQVLACYFAILGLCWALYDTDAAAQELRGTLHSLSAPAHRLVQVHTQGNACAVKLIAPSLRNTIADRMLKGG